MVTKACQRLIDTVFETLRTYISLMIEKLAPAAAKARGKAQETIVEAKSMAHEIKASAEQQVATAYGKATRLTKNAGSQAEGIMEESKAQLKDAAEVAAPDNNKTKARAAGAATAKTSAEKPKKASASKTGKHAAGS